MRNTQYNTQYNEGRYEYDIYLRRLCQSNRDEMEDMTRRLRDAVSLELTPRQLEYIDMYYFRRMSMPEIARLENINISTVSRTLARARVKLQRCLRYMPEKIK